MDHKFDTSKYVKIPAISKDKDYDQLLADARELQKALDQARKNLRGAIELNPGNNVVAFVCSKVELDIDQSLETFSKKYGKE